MRFQKHGEVLAIALPESLRNRLGIKEGDEYEFAEVEDGLLALVKKDKIGSLLSDKVKNNLASNAPKNLAPQLQQLKKTDWTSTGFLVLDDEEKAKEFSHKYQAQIKSGEIHGVRGFDRKYYLATHDFYQNASDKIIVCLKDGPMRAEEVAKTTNIALNGCITALFLLKEEGEILEKKRGEFSLVK
ncbi:AbrB/MazE/SpoVT family DNA-binding domain-containing protein [Candidatus Micrarchaeota archaeon]|nr:AbrB/MazE/SpoVT family DNA-binding domain-containing protein [Candidatus Micrarchaeota archaeon]